MGLEGADSDDLSVAGRSVRTLFMTGGGPAVKSMKEAAYEDRTLLAKPFSRMQLLDKVQQALRSREGSSDAAES